MQLLEKKQEAPNGVTCAKPMSANQNLIPNLIAVSASPRDATFHCSVWNNLVSTSEVTCQIDPCGPRRKVTLPETIHFVLETFFSCPLLLIKAFHFV